MQTSDLRLLFEYNYWASRRLIEVAASLSDDQFTQALFDADPDSVRDKMVHTFSAEWLWRLRCQDGISPPRLLHGEEFPTVDVVRSRWAVEEAAMMKYLTGLSDLDLTKSIYYTTTTGAGRKNVLWQILTHVVNHGTQHRSEIATMLTELGHSPGDMDLIVFMRQR
ncbi:DinB family protein [Chloroflexota bacterium]